MQKNPKTIKKALQLDRSGQYPVFVKKLIIEKEELQESIHPLAYTVHIKVDAYQSEKTTRMTYNKFISKPLPGDI